MKNESRKISEEDVQQIAVLTRIAMSQSEINLMAGQMSNILENIDVSDIKNLSADTLSALKELAPEVIIFTSDASLSFPLLQVAEYFNKQGIGTEFMSRASACHTYNLLLVEDRSVILIVSP